MNNFAVLDITQTMIPDGIRITITTNTPCHLTCYYTDKEPGSHRTSRNQRGLTLPWGVYYCFVAWLSLEQTEPGDTLIHTFDITPWTYCQTKWVAFRGTVAGVLSPSVSPIFKKHYAFTLYEYLNTGANIASGTIGPEIWFAQTFTPLEAHTIVSVRLLLYRVGTPGLVRISITPTDAEGHPILAFFTSGQIDGNALTLDDDGEWYSIPFPGSPLEVGTKYGIVLRSQARGLYWRGDWRDSYPRGNLFTSGNSGETWSPSTWDFLFEDWGTPL
ncbi:hypothetical protein ES705_46606 [subsurface metagenome]